MLSIWSCPMRVTNSETWNVKRVYFIILSQVVFEKSLTENVHMHYIGVRDGNKRKIKKEGKINISTLVFYYTIYLATL